MGAAPAGPGLALGAFLLFYAIEYVSYLRHANDWTFHLQVSIVLAIWIAVSLVCQHFLEAPRWGSVAPFAWGGVDSALLLSLLLISSGVASALLVGYPLLIVGSALWFRVRFVWFMTGLSMLSYSVLVLNFYALPPKARDGFPDRFDRHLVFLASLLVLGLVVAYVVQRVRLLTAYYGRRVP